MRIHHSAWLALVAALLLAGCATSGAPRSGPPLFGPDLSQSAAPQSLEGTWARWLGEDPSGALADFEAHLGDPDPARAALARWGQSEALRQAGQMDPACQGYLKLLEEHPGDRLARWAAWRLWELRDHAAGWTDLVQQADGLIQTAPMEEATRAWWAQSLLNAHYRAWRGQGHPGTFAGDTHGFPQRWRIAGPFSIFPRHHRDLPAPGEDVALADQYEINGKNTPSTSIVFDEPFGDPLFSQTGVYVLETWVQTQGEGWLVHLDSDADVQVQVDDLLVFDRDQSRGYPPQHLGAALTLAPGAHRLRVRLAVQEGNERFRLQLLPRGAGSMSSLEAPAQAPGQASAAQGQALPARALFTPALSAAQTQGRGFLSWMRALAAQGEGDHDQALEALAQAPEGAAAVQLTWGDVLRGASNYPEQTRQDLATARYHDALERAPEAWLAADRLAYQWILQGQTEKATELLEALAQALPGEYLVHYHLYQIYQERGWSGPAREALARALSLYPTNCSLVEQQWSEWIGLDQWPARESLSPELLSCDITHLHLANHYDLPRGDVEAAARSYERLVARNPRSVQYRQTLGGLYDRLGRREEADRAYAQGARLALSPVGVQLRRYDGLLAHHPGEAGQWLKARLEESEGSYDLRRALLQHQGENALEDLRVDGLELIRQYRANPLETDSSGVYLLDYAATRVYPDGSALTLTHNVIRVQNKEGIDRFGEVSVPGEALLMRLRTIKPDGRTLEPEFIPGKPSVSMPNLAPGDFIEVEYLEGASGSHLRQGAYDGFRFFFHIYDAPLLRSEYVLELPEGWEPTIQYRNGAPKAQVSQPGQGRARYRFQALRSPQPVQEPNGPPSTEVLPSVLVIHNYTWADLYRTYRDKLMVNMRADAHLRRAVAQAIQGKKSQDAQARALFRLVLDEISDDGTGPFAQPAAQTLHAGSGDRLMVLKVMLDEAGIKNELVLARSWTQDQIQSPVPEVDNWGWVLLRAWTDQREVWLDPSLNHAIYGFIPLAVQGNQGVRLGEIDPAQLQGQRPQALFVDIPRLPIDADLREVSLVLALDERGNLSGQGQESYTGSGATLLRRIVDSYTDAEELKQALAQSMGSTFPGLEVQSLDFEHREDTSQPLVMKYRFSAPGFARVQEGALLVERGFFVSDLATSYAALPERRLPLLVADPLRLKMKVRLAFPKGWRVVQGVKGAELETPFGLWLRREQDSGQSHELVWSQALTLPIQRVAPGDYEAFRRFAQSVDQDEKLRLKAAPR